MTRFAFVVLFTLAAYIITGTVAYVLLMMLTSEDFHQSRDAAIAAWTTFGPIGALIGLVAGLEFPKWASKHDRKR